MTTEPRPAHPHDRAASDDLRVSSLELFFDLVFVFTLTQLTSLLAHDLAAETVLRVVLIFVVLYWMYSGYGWLTNQVPPDRTGRRLLLILGMAAFLLCALAIPRAFGEGGVAFGLGYLAVVALHAGLYGLVLGTGVAPLAALNVLAALAVTAAGLVAGSARYGLWLGAILIQLVTPLMVGRERRFELRPRHFVERHGLLLIVALGESVVAVGIGIGDVAPSLGVFLTASLGLALAAALWWAYFVGDEEAAERAMVAASPAERFRLAINAYFFAYIPMLLGIVAIAAGVEHALGHVGERLDRGSALVLAAGVAAHLAGDVLFRRVMGIRPVATRAVASVAALATVVPGMMVAALAELVLLLAILVATLAWEATLRSRHAQTA